MWRPKTNKCLEVQRNSFPFISLSGKSSELVTEAKITDSSSKQICLGWDECKLDGSRFLREGVLRCVAANWKSGMIARTQSVYDLPEMVMKGM